MTTIADEVDFLLSPDCSHVALTAIERITLRAVQELQQGQDPDRTRDVGDMRVSLHGAINRAAAAEEQNAELARQVLAITADRDRLVRFKELTHEALDAAGVPTNPVNELRRILSGHRMVDRINWLAESRDEWQSAAGHIGARCGTLDAANADLRELAERERVIGLEWQTIREDVAGELRAALGKLFPTETNETLALRSAVALAVSKLAPGSSA